MGGGYQRRPIGGGLTFKMSQQGGRGLKSEDFRETSFIDGP